MVREKKIKKEFKFKSKINQTVVSKLNILPDFSAAS